MLCRLRDPHVINYDPCFSERKTAEVDFVGNLSSGKKAFDYFSLQKAEGKAVSERGAEAGANND